jgi:hypothetical protein
MKTNIDDLVKLTSEQEALAKQMKELYGKMLDADMAFALNENSEVVVYNSKHIAGCEFPPIGCQVPDGFEEADMDAMNYLFPIWTAEKLYLSRKEG